MIKHSSRHYRLDLLYFWQQLFELRIQIFDVDFLLMSRQHFLKQIIIVETLDVDKPNMVLNPFMLESSYIMSSGSKIL